MRVAVHFGLSSLAQITAFVVGALVAFFAIPRALRAWLDLAAIIPVGGTALAATTAARWIMRRLPARCPECGGRASQKGGQLIYYECIDCGHTVPTGIRVNW
jgi:DNA-directed RNA polymerase subunit RPC12/RpoP